MPFVHKSLILPFYVAEKYLMTKFIATPTHPTDLRTYTTTTTHFSNGQRKCTSEMEALHINLTKPGKLSTFRS